MSTYRAAVTTPEGLVTNIIVMSSESAWLPPADTILRQITEPDYDPETGELVSGDVVAIGDTWTDAGITPKASA